MEHMIKSQKKSVTVPMPKQNKFSFKLKFELCTSNPFLIKIS